MPWILYLFVNNHIVIAYFYIGIARFGCFILNIIELFWFPIIDPSHLLT